MSEQQQSNPASSSSPQKPIIIGIYGVPASGKTTLINKLKSCLSDQYFAFYEGSTILQSLVAGSDLEIFKRMSNDDKNQLRERAIRHIQKECLDSGKTGIVVGHYSFWTGGVSSEDGMPGPVMTTADTEVYTHILYLHVEGETIARRVAADESRDDRQRLDVSRINSWQIFDIIMLRDECRKGDILFSVVNGSRSHDEEVLSRVQTLIEDFHEHDEARNLKIAIDKLDGIMDTCAKQPEAMLLIDGDKTLIAEDSGELFWANTKHIGAEDDPLSKLFGNPPDYSYTAFRQATLLYDEYSDFNDFEARCQAVAATVSIHDEFLDLLRKIKGQQSDSVRAVIVTCGLATLFRKVLAQAQLTDVVQVIGGGRIEDQYVMTAGVKAALVQHLQTKHGVYVWAFGDSSLDLPMLKAANEAIVAVVSKENRSKSMEAHLADAIELDGLRARQVLLPRRVSPRLSADRLPIVKLSELSILEAPRGRVKVIEATKQSAAKLLMTPMRNAAVFGPALQEAHRQVGKFLATAFVSEELGLEEYPIKHVQDGMVDGYRLKQESKTLIVALMRGGEAMAFGVSNAFPQAMFLHAKEPGHMQRQHLQACSTVILVDSVINNGDTVVEFVTHIRSVRPTPRIVVVTGVAQTGATKVDGTLDRSGVCGGVTVVALRTSENKYTGKGKTDTGARLFNTVQLECD